MGVVAVVAFLGFTPQGHAICSSVGKIFLGAAGAVGGAASGKPSDSPTNFPSAPTDNFVSRPSSQQKNDNSGYPSGESSMNTDHSSTQVPESVSNIADASTQTEVVVNQYLGVDDDSLQTEQFISANAIDMSVQNIIPQLPRIHTEHFATHGSQIVSRIAHHTTNETLRVFYENGVPLDSHTIGNVMATNHAAVANGYAAGIDGATRLLHSGGTSAEAPQQLLSRIDAVTPATVEYSQNMLGYYKGPHQLSSVIEETVPYFYSFIFLWAIVVLGFIWAFSTVRRRR